MPPLPPVTSLGPGYENYVWFYDQSYTITEYTFTNLDKTTMANVQPRSSRLYAHALMTWLISFVAMWQFWRYSKVALRMRMLHLLTAPRGVETHTVLCTDVPGVNHGTIPDRLDGTLLRLVPNSIKKQAMSQANKLKAKSSMLMPGNRAGSGRIDVEAVPGVMPAAAQPGQPGSGDSEGPASGIVSPFAPLAGAGPTTDPAATVYPTDPGAAAASSKDGAALPASDPYDDGVITADEFADMNAIDTDHWEMPDRWEEACDKLNAGRSVQDMAHEIFRQIYADDLSHVHVVYNTSKLDPLVATYQKMKSNAERAVDVALTRAHAGKKMKPKTTRVIGATMGQWGKDKYGTKPKKVDAFEYYADRMEHLWGCIQDEQENARRHAFPSAFVTFKKRTAQVVAGGALMSEDLTTWRCQAAPRVQEVLWSNLG